MKTPPPAQPKLRLKSRACFACNRRENILRVDRRVWIWLTRLRSHVYPRLFSDSIYGLGLILILRYGIAASPSRLENSRENGPDQKVNSSALLRSGEVLVKTASILIDLHRSISLF